ncbi:MAG: glycine betaine ABC transporter substrate-binding protein [Nitriliruptoraceae bacterium]
MKLTIVSFGLVALVACTSAPATGDDAVALPAVTVAAGPDSESLLLAHIVVALLDVNEIAGEVVNFVDSRDSRQALELGAVDLRIGYTGETWLETLARADPPSNPRESFAAVRDFDAQRGITWLPPRFSENGHGPPANATFAFVIQGPPSADADLVTMSQFASRLSARPEAMVCVDREFATRPDGLPAVLSAYSVRSDRAFLAAEPDQAVLGVAAGDCLAGLTTTTDPDAFLAGLRPLIDDLGVFPAFVPSVQIRTDIADDRPQIRFAVMPLPLQLTTPMLAQWNARVRAGESIEDVATSVALQLREGAGTTSPNAET